jgi:uncharacterized membrane protein HdeD (DUF308 family)
MTAIANDRITGTLMEETNRIQKSWGWFLALSIVQIVAGILAVDFAFTATFASVAMLGVLLLVAAGAQTAAALWARDWSGFFLFLLIGVLYAVAGFVTLTQPIVAAESLTLMLAAAFLIGGLYRIVLGLVERFPSRGWVVLNGVIAVLLGIAILWQWPGSGLWVLGMFVGIDLIVNGVTWSVLAVGIRNAAAPMTGPAENVSHFVSAP